MTLKTAVDSAVLRVIGTVPTAVFSSSEQVSIEMADLSNEVAHEISEAGEWRRLVRIAEMVGASSFPIPEDYDRMLTAQGIQDKEMWLWGYFPFASVSEYMRAVNGNLPTMSPGGWIILDGEFKFYPAPVGIATFPYISRYFVVGDDDVRKADFTQDNDRFLLPERLLTLGLIWRWKMQKGIDYSSDYDIYLESLNQELNKEKGGRMLRPDVRMNIPGIHMAYPYRRL